MFLCTTVTPCTGVECEAAFWQLVRGSDEDMVMVVMVVTYTVSSLPGPGAWCWSSLMLWCWCCGVHTDNGVILTVIFSCFIPFILFIASRRNRNQVDWIFLQTFSTTFPAQVQGPLSLYCSSTVLTRMHYSLHQPFLSERKERKSRQIYMKKYHKKAKYLD